MSTFFGEKNIALEPIPQDATAVVVRVETWEKMEADLATLRAELDAKTAEVEKLRKVLKEVMDWDSEHVGHKRWGQLMNDIAEVITL